MSVLTPQYACGPLSGPAGSRQKDSRGTVRGGTATAPAVAERPVNIVPIGEHRWKRKPFAHQLEAFNRGARRSKFMFLMEQGTGKTDVMANAVAWHHVNRRIYRVLVVAPLSVIPSWLEVLEASFAPAYRAHWLEGASAKKLQALEDGLRESADESDPNRPCTFFFINYQAIARLEPDLARICADAIILDESQNIKNHRAKTTLALVRLRKNARFRYVGTGTLITQDAYDAFSQCAWTNPGILGHRRITTFRAEFVSRYHPVFKAKVVEWKNLEALGARIAEHSFRVLKSECLDLPPKLYQKRLVNLSPEQKRVYNDVATEFAAELDCGTVISADHLLSRLTKLAQITGGFLRNEDGGSIELKPNAKLAELMEICDGLDTKAKAIIWCRFTDEINCIVAALNKKYGAGSAVAYYGGTPGPERGRIVRRFQDEEHPRWFVGQPAAGGAGITLTRATYAIYYSNSYRLEHRLQSEDRCHRLGTSSQVTYIDLLARDTMDAYILKLLKLKKSLADVVNRDDIRAMLKPLR